MALFGNDGFFDRLGDWLGGAAKKAGKVIEDVADFVTGLPNDIIEFGEDLGRMQDELMDRVSDGSGDVRDNIRERRARQFFVDNGPIMLAGIAILAIIALKK